MPRILEKQSVLNGRGTVFTYEDRNIGTYFYRERIEGTKKYRTKTMLTYITEKSNESGSDQILIFENPNIQTKSIYSGRNLSDWNDSKLMRSRGGLIAAATKGRKDIFDKNHFIFPVKSIDGSRSRFLYKSTLGHTIIKNYKNYKK